MKNFLYKRLLLPITIISILFIVACSKNNDYSPQQPIIPENTDIVQGRLFHVVNVDELDRHWLPLSTSEDIDISASPNEYYDFKTILRHGVLNIVPVKKKEQTSAAHLVKIKISPKEKPEKARNIAILFTKNIQYSQSEPLLSVYSEYIGKSTRIYEELGNTVQSVLLYDKVTSLSDEFLSVNSTLNSIKMFEISGDSYQSTMTEWGFNIGISGNFTKKPRVLATGVTKDKTWSISGSFNFGMEGSISSSAAYEYYMNIYSVKKAEIGINMSNFEVSDNNRIDTDKYATLLSMVSSSYINQLFYTDTTKFNPNKFYDDWGTEIITQGVFGGYNLYIYGRSENSYEHSVGVDACGSLKISHPSSTTGSWLDLYKSANSNYVKAEADVEYKNEEYQQASKAKSFFATVGGNISDNNAQAWLDGFNDENTSEKWALVGYRRLSDESQGIDSTKTSLYPIENLAWNILAGWKDLYDTLTIDDSLAFTKAVANIDNLVEAKESYIKSHAYQMGTKPRLVVADFMCKNGSNGHKKGEPQPFVGTDPRNESRKWIYYPIMASKYAPVDAGYALETSQSEYYRITDGEDHYWYYALALETDCDGLVEIRFAESGESGLDYYYQRGNDARVGGTDISVQNHTYVKYYDPDDKTYTRDDIITAIALMEGDKNEDGDDDDVIIGSTGGSELKRNCTQSEENAWKEFWKDYQYTKKDYWNHGGATHHPKQFYPIFSTKTLPIGRVSDATVCHPYKW